MNTTVVGDRANGCVLAALLRVKDAVLLPFGDGLRYDLVFEEGGRFFRVQSKHGVIRGNAVRFRACSSTGKGAHKVVRDYRGDVEFFGVYVSESGKTYLVPVEAVGISVATLRLGHTKNNQTARVKWARDYEI